MLLFILSRFLAD